MYYKSRQHRTTRCRHPCCNKIGWYSGGGGASKVLSPGTAPVQLHSRELSLIQQVHVIPADHSRRHCEIVVLSGGRWDVKLEHMPAYTHKAYTSGGQLQEPFPLMPGTQWHRSFQGRHAAVVHKERVTILFEIQMSVANLEQPLFVARDFHEGLFCKRLSATSAGALEKAWLSQNRMDGDPEISLSNMKGASFMGLDIPGFTNYLAGLVPSFQGARFREKERGRSKEDIGPRQKRRLQACLLEDFESTLGKVFPDDLAEAFELLQSSQAFKTRFLPAIHYRFAQDDTNTQALVDMYKAAVSKKDKMQAQWVLALYSPFHTQEHTMQLFQCSKHACEQANLAHRIRNLPAPQKSCILFSVLCASAVLPCT